MAGLLGALDDGDLRCHSAIRAFGRLVEVLYQKQEAEDGADMG